MQSRVALCGTFSESRGHACSLQGQIRSKNHRPRRRDRALPKSLNLLVEGSIPSVTQPSAFGLGLAGSIPSGLTTTSFNHINSFRVDVVVCLSGLGVPCGTNVALFQGSLLSGFSLFSPSGRPCCSKKRQRAFQAKRRRAQVPRCSLQCDWRRLSKCVAER